MPIVTFFRILLLVFGATVLLFQGISWINPAFALCQDIFWIGQTFFISLFLFSYFVGKKLVHHPNINFYSQFNLFYIFTKMMFCISIVVVYVSLKKPITHHYLLVLLLLYTVYTVVNIYVLNKIGREREGLKKY
jgi:heme A synthase